MRPSRGSPSPFPMPRRRLLAVAVARSGSLVARRRRPLAPTGPPATLVRLTAAAACTEAAVLVAPRAREVVDAKLRLWRLHGRGSPTAARAGLRGARVARVRPGEHDVRRRRASPTTPDPLQADEWWRAADRHRRPDAARAPACPVTVVDSGVDVTHPEFAGRADTLALNAQEPRRDRRRARHLRRVARSARRSTASASSASTRRRVLRSWDAAKGDGTRLESSEIAGGILAAARAGASVINLSLGSDTRDLAIELAVSEAVAHGLARRRRVRERRRPRQPARLPGRVPARDHGRPRPTGPAASSAFSSRSPYVDLAAPGRRHPRRQRARQELASDRPGRASRPRSSRARRPGSGPCGPELDAGPGRRGPPALRARHRPAGARPRVGLRDAERRRGARAAGADPRPVRAERRRRRGRLRTATGTSRRLRPLTTRRGARRGSAARVDAYEDPRDVYPRLAPGAWPRDAPRSRSHHRRRPRALPRDRAERRRPAPATAAASRSAATTAAATSGSRSGTAGAGRWAYVVGQLPAGTLDATYRLAPAAARYPRRRLAQPRRSTTTAAWSTGRAQHDVGLPHADARPPRAGTGRAARRRARSRTPRAGRRRVPSETSTTAATTSR